MKTLTLGLLCFGLVAPSVFAEAIAPSLKDDLVALNGKHVGKFDDAPLANAKYFAVYFSASWCPPCRAFTPDLVKWYNENKPKHPEFELVLVSHDYDEKSMEAYMTGDNMPWPALKYSKIKSNKSLRQYAGPGIPCLVFVDADGKVLSNSYEGANYVGPRKVLKDIEKTLGGGSSTAPAAATGTSASAGVGSSIGTTGTGTGIGVGVGTKPSTVKSPQGSNFDEFFKKNK
jgi:thiol-disulfide isomerase/thioredoxin